MAAPVYASVATVRNLLDEITTDIADSDKIGEYDSTVAIPKINMRLGITSNLSTVPAIIALIASRYVACEIVNGRLHEDDSESAWAAAQCEKADAELAEIVSGAVVVDGISNAMVVVSDPSADWQAEQTFTDSDELKWAKPTIARASS